MPRLKNDEYDDLQLKCNGAMSANKYRLLTRINTLEAAIATEAAEAQQSWKQDVLVQGSGGSTTGIHYDRIPADVLPEMEREALKRLDKSENLADVITTNFTPS